MDFNILTSLSDNIRIDREKCTACSRCAEICVLDNLRLHLSPCRQACPIGMNCQEYIRLLARGKLDKGQEKIREAVPFGGILGRVCSRPCEAACHRLKVDGQSLAIRDLKRFLADQEEPPGSLPAGPEFSQQVAIIGAGPAGLMAAFHLRRAGFQVTLYDKESEPGGLLRWALPEFRLPQETLQRELAFLQSMKIEFIGDRTLGKDLDLKKLTAKFKAILLALGAGGQMRLQISGEDAPSVFPVLDFMKNVRRNQAPKVGKRVVVIGGGNAAVDAAQTALRLGAEKVCLVSLEKRNEMPAFLWSVTEAEEEGVILQNGWGPQRFRLERGKITGASFKKCTAVLDSQGRFSPAYDEKTTMDLGVDTVLVAIGQKTEVDFLDPSLRQNGQILCDPVTFQTRDAKIFVAGDSVRGPKTIVEAFSQGKEAALSIERFLKGEDLYYGRGNGNLYEAEFTVDFTKAKPRARVPMRQLAPAKRKGFQEVALGYTKEEAIAEAERCLNCGVPFGIRTCWFCLPCEIECPEEALYVEIPYLLR